MTDIPSTESVRRVLLLHGDRRRRRHGPSQRPPRPRRPDGRRPRPLPCCAPGGPATSPPVGGTEIYYKDWGKGPVVTFSHGWPLNADAWDGQMLFLAQHGYRVVAVDRRGHGRSSQVSNTQ
jgi:hypothetical protein